LYNLADFLPKQPDETALKVIKEMFEASVDGQPYDPDRWANYYKPAGFQGGSGSTGDDSEKSTPVAKAAPAPVATPAPVAESAPFDTDEDDTPAPTAPVQAAKPSSQKAEDILAMIRNRQK
jgi:hypothetical protein